MIIAQQPTTIQPNSRTNSAPATPSGPVDSSDINSKSPGTADPNSMRKLALSGGFWGLVGGANFLFQGGPTGPGDLVLRGVKDIAIGTAAGAAGGAALTVAAHKLSKNAVEYSTKSLATAGAKEGAAAVARITTTSVVSPLVGMLISNGVAHLGGGTAAILVAAAGGTVLTGAGLNIALTRAQEKFLA